MILIIGGTSALGNATAQRLLSLGQAVRVMTRTPSKAKALQLLGAEVIQGDLLDPASLQKACTSMSKVLASAHSIFGKGREASKYVDLQGHKTLIDAAQAAGVQHFVYTSVYHYGPEYTAVPFFQIKSEVEQYLKSSQLNYTILRPTAFFETHAEIMIGQPILEKGKVSLFGKGENPRNFVAADDVAQFAVMALLEGKFNNQAVEIGGPQNLTNMDVVALYEKVMAKAAKVTHVPLAALQVMYRVLRPLHPGLSQVMQMSILSDTTDATFDMQPLLTEYPLTLTRLEDWIPKRVSSEKVQSASVA